eukprot:jgi/Chlat1/7307/Chrsp58S06932
MAPEPDASLLPDEADLAYEEELLRNPFALKTWWRYLHARKDAPPRKRQLIYERALKALPGSYKLWYAYLKERRAAVRGLCITHQSYASLNNTYERALVTMHKMPRIWEEYLQFLLEQRFVTKMRRTCDRALCSLPVTQHDRVWTIYLKFVRQPGMPVETSLRVYRRYLKLEPGQLEEYVDYLLNAAHYEEAALRLAEFVNNDDLPSLKGKTKHQLWLELCDLVTKHPKEVMGLNVDAIIRSGIRKFTNEVGRLWTSLADFYIRRGLFEKARDVYEEGLTTVVTVRDFSLIFDAYAQFEESIISAKMESAAEEADADHEGEEEWTTETTDLDLRLARLEHLMDRRPELVSSVMLRQNPHNVHEWHKRVKLFEGNLKRQILTFTEAVKTVDIQKAVGKPHSLWVAFAKFYEEHNSLADARIIFEKAVLVPYKGIDDLATVWCEWAEMELRHKNFKGALDVMKKATSAPVVRRTAGNKEELPVQARVHKSLKLWSFFVDLEESLGTLESTKAVYDRILDLKIATPQIVINYAHLLEENKYFEEAFRVYERGVQIFQYPHVKEIWQLYLSKFIARYKGTKLERARDLFEQAVEKVPPTEAKSLYLQYAKLEEDYGLTRHAMAVYARAVQAVRDEDKLSVYEIYIARATEFFGVSKTREIYEQAIESGLPDKQVKTMCLRYAALERSLGEIDRARAVFIHASQLANPATDPGFWEEWNQFEIKHGSEDTFREMLRIKRSVSAAYSQVQFIVPDSIAAAIPGEAAAAGEKRKRPDEDDMAALERAAVENAAAPASKQVQFVSAARIGGDDAPAARLGSAAAVVESAAAAMAVNPEEIELAEDQEDEEEEGATEMDISEKPVPDAVFGGLKAAAEATEEGKKAEPQLGALARLRSKQRG